MAGPCSFDRTAGLRLQHWVQAAEVVLDMPVVAPDIRPHCCCLEGTSGRSLAGPQLGFVDSHLEDSLPPLAETSSPSKLELQLAADLQDQHLVLLQTHMLDLRRRASSCQQLRGHPVEGQEELPEEIEFRSCHSSDLLEGVVATS